MVRSTARGRVRWPRRRGVLVRRSAAAASTPSTCSHRRQHRCVQRRCHAPVRPRPRRAAAGRPEGRHDLPADAERAVRTRSTRSASTPVRTLRSSAARSSARLTAYKFSTDSGRGHARSCRPRDRHRHRQPTAARPGASRSVTASPARTARPSPARTSSTASRARSRPTSSPAARPTRSRSSTSRTTRGRLVAYKGPYTGDRPGPVRQGRDLLRGRQDDHVQPEHARRRTSTTPTTLGFVAVPKAADTGEKYGDKAPSPSRPARTRSRVHDRQGRQDGPGPQPELEPGERPVPQAYPDKWEVDFGLDPTVIDQRLIQSAGNDADRGPVRHVQPENLADGLQGSRTTPNDQFADACAQRASTRTPATTWINIKKVTNLKIRQAMAVALDREAIRNERRWRLRRRLRRRRDQAEHRHRLRADRHVGPTASARTIPDTGDPELPSSSSPSRARPLRPHLRLPEHPDHDKAARSSATRSARPASRSSRTRSRPASTTASSSTRQQGRRASVTAGWGPDWPNASTVIPPLFTHDGGFNLSQVDDKAFNDGVAAALGRDSTAPKQATQWQALNKEAMQNVVRHPDALRPRPAHRPATKVGNVYLWAAYGSWPYGDLYVTPVSGTTADLGPISCPPGSGASRSPRAANRLVASTKAGTT